MYREEFLLPLSAWKATLRSHRLRQISARRPEPIGMMWAYDSILMATDVVPSIRPHDSAEVVVLCCLITVAASIYKIVQGTFRSRSIIYWLKVYGNTLTAKAHIQPDVNTSRRRVRGLKRLLFCSKNHRQAALFGRIPKALPTILPL